MLKQFTGILGLGAALGGQLVTSPLGELTGSIETSTSGMKGKLTLTFD